VCVCVKVCVRGREKGGDHLTTPSPFHPFTPLSPPFEPQPLWWQHMPPEGSSGGGEDDAPSPTSNRDPNQPAPTVGSLGRESAWVSVELEGIRKPVPRNDQDAVVAGNHLFVVGGHCNGRFLSDVWQFNVTTLHWGRLELVREVLEDEEGEKGPLGELGAEAVPLAGAESAARFPPVAGHTVTAVGHRLLVLGGFVKVTSVGWWA